MGHRGQGQTSPHSFNVRRLRVLAHSIRLCNVKQLKCGSVTYCRKIQAVKFSVNLSCVPLWTFICVSLSANMLRKSLRVFTDAEIGKRDSAWARWNHRGRMQCIFITFCTQKQKSE